MKTFFILLLFPILLFSQEKINEKQAIEKSHINFNREYLFFVISGAIEIDGHTFINDTSKTPIIFKATIDGISIVDTSKNIEYQHRKCDEPNCPILHLEIKQQPTLILPRNNWWGQPDIRPL